LLPTAVIRARLSGAEELAIGTQVLPSSATQTDSAAAGAGVLAGTVGLAWDAAALPLGAVMPLAPADGRALADAPALLLGAVAPLAPADAPALLLGAVAPLAPADALADAPALANAVAPLPDAGAPQARNVPLTVVTPSMATVVSSEKAVDLVQALPSADDQEAARPGAVSLVSVPTTTMWPFAPAMPRASKPSSEVAALAQSRPVAEYQAAEPLLRDGPVPFQRPTTTKPPSHALTALSV
jgi:hypothetical protein